MKPYCGPACPRIPIQVELRILAHCSLDENLIAAFGSREDIHAFTARQLLHIDPDQPLSVAQKRIGKTINFGVIYGAGAIN